MVSRYIGSAYEILNRELYELYWNEVSSTTPSLWTSITLKLKSGDPFLEVYTLEVTLEAVFKVDVFSCHLV